MATLGGCFKQPIVIVDGSEPAHPDEGDRVAEKSWSNQDVYVSILATPVFAQRWDWTRGVSRSCS